MRSSGRQAVTAGRTGLVALVALGSGCVRNAPAAPPRLITMQPVTAAHVVFPTSRRQTTDPSLCTSIAAPDTTIAYQRVSTESRYLGALGLRLPAAYLLTSRFAELPPPQEAFGGMLVASWRRADAVEAPATRAPGVGVWVVPENALPTVGAEPGTQQVAFAACPAIIGGRAANAALFTLVTRAESTTYLAAVWPAPRGRHVQLLASARRPDELAPVRRALLDVVLAAPTRR
jgi:hypothetical protein